MLSVRPILQSTLMTRVPGMTSERRIHTRVMEQSEDARAEFLLSVLQSRTAQFICKDYRELYEHTVGLFLTRFRSPSHHSSAHWHSLSFIRWSLYWDLLPKLYKYLISYPDRPHHF